MPSEERIADIFRDLLTNRSYTPRPIRMFTNASGLDQFHEMMEKDAGFYRIYVKKLPRIFKNVVLFKKSYSKGSYVLKLK